MMQFSDSQPYACIYIYIYISSKNLLSTESEKTGCANSILILLFRFLLAQLSYLK